MPLGFCRGLGLVAAWQTAFLTCPAGVPSRSGTTRVASASNSIHLVGLMANLGALTLLRNSWLFKKLDNAIIERLGGLCATRQYSKGEVVFVQGDDGTRDNWDQICLCFYLTLFRIVIWRAPHRKSLQRQAWNCQQQAKLRAGPQSWHSQLSIF